MATKRGEAAQEIVQRPAKVVMAARPAHPKTATMARLPDRKRKMTPAPVEGERMRSSAIDTYIAKETPVPARYVRQSQLCPQLDVSDKNDKKTQDMSDRARYVRQKL